MTDRIGYWVDMDDPYVTLENDYIETGWWILKQLWDRGLLYQDRRRSPPLPPLRLQPVVARGGPGLP